MNAVLIFWLGTILDTLKKLLSKFCWPQVFKNLTETDVFPSNFCPANTPYNIYSRVYEAVSAKQEDLSSILPKRIPIPEIKVELACPFDLGNTRPVCLTTFAPRQGPNLVDFVTEPNPLPFEDVSKAHHLSHMCCF